MSGNAALHCVSTKEKLLIISIEVMESLFGSLPPGKIISASIFLKNVFKFPEINVKIFPIAEVENNSPSPASVEEPDESGHLLIPFFPIASIIRTAASPLPKGLSHFPGNRHHMHRRRKHLFCISTGKNIGADINCLGPLRILAKRNARH